MGIVDKYFSERNLLENTLRTSISNDVDQTKFINSRKVFEFPDNEFEDFFVDRLIRFLPVSMMGPMHRHNYIEMIYIYSGTLVQKINNDLRTYLQGEICILDENTLHAEVNELGEDDIIIYFGMSKEFFHHVFHDSIEKEKNFTKFISHNLLESKKEKQYISFQNYDDEEIRHLVENIIQTYFEKGDETCIKEYLKSIFLKLVSRYEISLSTEEIERLEDQAFLAIDEYMKQHLNDVSRQELSKRFFFDTGHINKIIKRNTGTTYSEYLVHLRMEKAVYLLKHTDLSINKIIEEIGYSNKSYFYKAFREAYGMTPQEFRIQNMMLKIR